MKNTIKKVIAILLAITTLISLCSCSVDKEAVDFSENVTVTFDGFNGYGTATLHYDSTFLEELTDVDKLSKFEKKFQEDGGMDAMFVAEYLKDYGDLFKVEFAEEYSNLSNGDVVKVNILVSDDMDLLGLTMEDVENGVGLSVADTELEFTVEGLSDSRTIDLFSDIENHISYSGLNAVPVNGEIAPSMSYDKEYEKQIGEFVFYGYSSSTLIVTYNDEKIGEIRYKIEDSSKEMSEGDTFTVKVSGYEFFENYGYMPAAESITITVPDVADKLTSKDQLTSDVLSNIQTKILGQLKEEKDNPESVEIVAKYYFEKKPNANPYSRLESGVVFVYSFTVDGWGTSGSWTSYSCAITEAVINTDGSADLVNTDCMTYRAYNSIEEAYSNLLDHDNYTFEKI